MSLLECLGAPVRVWDDQECAQNILLQELKFEVFAGPIYVECLYGQCSNSWLFMQGFTDHQQRLVDTTIILRV